MAPPGQEAAAHGGDADSGEVPDGGYLKLDQPIEDVADENQNGEIDERRDPGRPGPEHDRDHDGGDHHVGRPHVDDVPGRVRQ